MTFPAVVFDLDGTLLDSLEDIGRAANLVLVQAGFPAHEMVAYRQFIGEGVGTLFRRALPVDAVSPDLVDRCMAGFREAYATAWNVATRPYPGIPELLDELSRRGCKLAVLSNKPDSFTRQCVEQLLDRWRFDVIFGERAGIPRKPDPVAALEIAERLRVPPAECLYLGDTSVDMQTATRAGMFAVGAAWGFRPVAELLEYGARAIVEQPWDVVALIDRGDPGAR